MSMDNMFILGVASVKAEDMNICFLIESLQMECVSS